MGSFQKSISDFITNKFGGLSKNTNIVRIVKFILVLLLAVILLYLGCWIYLFKTQPNINLLTELRSFVALALSGATIAAFAALLNLLVDTNGDGIPEYLEDKDNNMHQPSDLKIPLPNNREIEIRNK